MTIQVHAGDQFHGWTVIGEVARTCSPCGQSNRRIAVRCACGQVTETGLFHLLYGHTHRCARCASDSHRPIVMVDGRPRFLGEVLRENGISLNTYEQRVLRGWPKGRAATKPVQKHSKMNRFA